MKTGTLSRTFRPFLAVMLSAVMLSAVTACGADAGPQAQGSVTEAAAVPETTEAAEVNTATATDADPKALTGPETTEAPETSEAAEVNMATATDAAPEATVEPEPSETIPETHEAVPETSAATPGTSSPRRLFSAGSTVAAPEAPAKPEPSETIPETHEAVPETSAATPGTSSPRSLFSADSTPAAPEAPAKPEPSETIPETQEAVPEPSAAGPETQEAVPPTSAAGPETSETAPENTAKSALAVEQNSQDVEMTISPRLLKMWNANVSSQEEADAMAERAGYKSAVYNDDGSLTLVMDKEKHQELLDSLSEKIDGLLAEIPEMQTVENVVSVEANSDYTVYTVRMESDTVSPYDEWIVTYAKIFGNLYGTVSGTPVDEIRVDFVNDADGTLIETR